MTVEKYRQRMINAFHNADCDNLIALVALPTKKEFEHLEWLLKNHYLNQKQEPCEDCISRQSVKCKLQEHHDLFINAYGGRVGFKSMADTKEKARVDEINNCIAMVVNEPPVTPKEKTGKWVDDNENEIDAQYGRHLYKCSECGKYANQFVAGIEDWWDIEKPNFCPNCGARMVSE